MVIYKLMTSGQDRLNILQSLDVLNVCLCVDVCVLGETGIKSRRKKFKNFMEQYV